MNLRVLSFGRRGGTVGTLVAVTATFLLAVAPVRAECNPSGADPSFRKAAPFAARILVGRVVAVAADELNPGDGTSYRFTVLVEQTLRGPATAVVAMDRVETGGCIRWLSAAVGDQVALALDVHALDPSVATNTVAWLGDARPDSSGYEILTLADVLDLAGGPDGPVAAPEPDGFDARPALFLTVLAIGILILWATRALRIRRR